MYSSRIGQANILTVVLFVGLVIVLGASLASYISSYIANINSEQSLRNAIQREIANTVIYKEYDDGSNLWLGLIRVDGTPATYFLLFINTSSCNIQQFNSQSIREIGVGIQKFVAPNNVYLLDQNGNPIPITIYYKDRYPLTMYQIYIATGGKPMLIGPINYSRVSGCRQIIFFISVNNNYYEVAKVYV